VDEDEDGQEERAGETSTEADGERAGGGGGFVTAEDDDGRHSGGLVGGTKRGAGAADLDTEPNVAGMEMLRQLPGITPTNLPLLLDAVSSLRELADLPLRKLQSIIAKANAKQLFQFLHYTGMRKAVSSTAKRGGLAGAR